jgi:non-specific serine/threonine protein kinase
MHEKKNVVRIRKEFLQDMVLNSWFPAKYLIFKSMSSPYVLFFVTYVQNIPAIMITFDPQSTSLLEKTHRIVLENIHNEQFGTKDLAEQLGMSRSSLHMKLKKESGYSTSRIIRRIRLNRAMELLKSSSANISQIAMDCGFNSISYFIKCFREEFGHPPGKFRSGNIRNSDDTVKENNRNKSHLNNFPAYPTAFFGRIEEMQLIDQLLKYHHLISLVGAGGSGKTRLACETLQKKEVQFTDGIWFVDLASLEKGAFVARELLETLQIPEIPGFDPQKLLKMKLAGRHMLIVLDNCEHVIDDCRIVAEVLCAEAKSVKILATSRLALDLPGEQVLPVSPLPIIDPAAEMNSKEALNFEAIQLFKNRAEISDSRFELADGNVMQVASICQKVDGIPLALELLASQIRYMDPGTMLERMAHKFSEIPHPDSSLVERQKTLQATIDWSFNLLTDSERNLFLRLGIFPGSFELEAVEAICTDESIIKEDILELLSKLVETNIVQTIRSKGESLGYKLLNTIREFALARLDESEIATFSKMHASYYLAIAEKAYHERISAQSYWMLRLHREHHNFLAALARSEVWNSMLHHSLTSYLLWFWSRSSNYKKAREIVEKGLSSEISRADIKARILSGYAKMVSAYPGQQERAIGMYKDAIHLWSGARNIMEEALTLSDLAFTYFAALQDEPGLHVAQQAVEKATLTGNKEVILLCKLALCQGFTNTKAISKARYLAKENIQAGEEIGNLYAQFLGHVNIADCAMLEADYRAAEKGYGRGIEIARSYGDFVYTCVSVSGVAMAVAGQGRHAKAQRLIAAVNRVTRQAGLMSIEDYPVQFWQELLDMLIIKPRDILGDTLMRQYEKEGHKMHWDEAVEYALEVAKDL